MYFEAYMYTFIFNKYAIASVKTHQYLHLHNSFCLKRVLYHQSVCTKSFGLSIEQLPTSKEKFQTNLILQL